MIPNVKIHKKSCLIFSKMVPNTKILNKDPLCLLNIKIFSVPCLEIISRQKTLK